MNKHSNIDGSIFLDLLLKGNRKESSKLIQAYFSELGSMKELYETVIKPTLYKIGELWELNKISVASEHLASAIVESILNEFYYTIISKEKKRKKIIVSCVENEFHQIGIKMVSDIFELNGWGSYFLGAHTPTNELIKFTKIIKPDMLAISLSIYFNLPTLETMIQKTRTEFPDLPILVGGQAFQQGGLDVIAKYSNVIYLPDLYRIEEFIKNRI